MTEVDAMTIIHLDQYRKTKATRVSVVDRHPRDQEYVAEEAIASLCATFCVRGPGELSPQLPDEPASDDLDRFLDCVRAIASQV